MSRRSFSSQAKPDLLKDAPGGDKFLSKDKATLERGKLVFPRTRALPFEQDTRCAGGRGRQELESILGLEQGRRL